MCGFLAIWQKNNSFTALDMEKLTSVFSHRGPDDEGYYTFGPVSFGFRRLKIIDLEGGCQPAVNEDESLTLVFNGEIYNYPELREKLIKKGHRFKSESDMEVILHLYEEEGERCVHQLRGMFAFCIHDRVKEHLFGARDRFGIKPLYYLETPEVFAIASEAKALLEMPGYQKNLNESAIPHYLSFQYVPEPHTMFKGIYKIPPGHTFTYATGNLKLSRYWRIKFNPREGSFQEFVEGTQHIMREAIKIHARSDVPLGSFLSGGIDSGIIAALLREHGPVSTFSVGYENPEYSELSEAAETARHLETDHEEYLVNPKEFWEHLPLILWHLDEPVADPAAISLFFVARLARKKITVTLSGEGADEVFGGYGIYHEPLSLRSVSWIPRSLLTAAGRGVGLLPGVPGKNYLKRAATPLRERFIGNARIFGEEEKKNILKQKNFLPATSVTDPLYDQAELYNYDEVTTMQFIDMHTWMIGDIMVKADKMTMANSLELRVPFLDHRVFEFAATVPVKYKIQNGLTKYVLRQSFRDLLPASAVNRPKRGFPVPTRIWLRGPLAGEIEELLSDPVLDKYFFRSAIKKLIDDHREGRADNSRRIWTLVVFMTWFNNFIKE